MLREAWLCRSSTWSFVLEAGGCIFVGGACFVHSSDLLFFLWFVWFVNCCNEGLEEEDEQMPDQHFEPLEEAIDPFLAALNSQCIGPGDYAAELVVNSTLNRQQILAVAPIAWVMEQMWLNRSNPQSTLADGAATESCNCLWLGAGGSGKT